MFKAGSKRLITAAELKAMDENPEPEIDEEFNYDGRLSDRVTEDDFETENLMRYDQKFADKVRIFV